MKNIDKSNYLYQMVHSKSKGNSINISQIISCVGQQNVQFKGSSGRIPFSSNNRTLPYYYQYDNRPESKGFVEHSYLDGLNVNEFFFHAQSGREGLIDTACKTAETGYIQRRLMKSLEDLNVKYDLTVRNEKGTVVQFCYGCDNFDPKKVEKQKFELILGSNKDFENKYKWDNKELKKYNEKTKSLLKKEYTSLLTLRRFFRNLKYHDDDIVYTPINIYRIVKQSRKKYSINDEETDLEPEYILSKIKYLNKEVIKLNCDNDYPFNELNDYNLKLLKTLVKSKLSTKIIISENKLTKEAFDWVVSTIEMAFYKALIQPGESVGAIAAQSLGEPTTQLSIIGDTEVKIKENGIYSTPKIGDLIDKYMDKYTDKTIQTHITENGKPSHILPIPKEWNITVPGLNYKTQKVEWKKVTEMSRHPPNGKLVKIKTKSGKTVIATLSHSFVTKRNNKVQTIRGDQLILGDIVPIMQ